MYFIRERLAGHHEIELACSSRLICVCHGISRDTAEQITIYQGSIPTQGSATKKRAGRNVLRQGETNETKMDVYNRELERALHLSRTALPISGRLLPRRVPTRLYAWIIDLSLCDGPHVLPRRVADASCCQDCRCVSWGTKSQRVNNCEEYGLR